MRMTQRALWLPALVLAVAASAAAGTKPQSRKVEILEKTSWNGKQLPVGEYKFVWQEDGTDLKVSVMSGRHVVAEGRGRLEERDTRTARDAVVSRRDGSGNMSLAELWLGGKKEVLVLAGS